MSTEPLAGVLVASGSIGLVRDGEVPVGKMFVGLDWAEAHHDVYVEDEAGRRLAAARLPEGVEGVARFHDLVAGLIDDPGEVTVATETDRGLFIGALVAAGYQVLAVNPMSTSRYRERLSTSGAKSDPGDARVLAGLARTDGHLHRPVAGDSDLAEAIKVLAWAHQSLIWTRHRQTNQLRSTLREFYPGALAAFDDLSGGDALAVLAMAPTPTLGPSPKPPAPAASSWPATPATAAWPTPATCGPSPRSPPAPAPAPTTTPAEPPATPTTAPCGPWPTASSASSTAAFATTPPTTNTKPGTTTPNSLLDT